MNAMKDKTVLVLGLGDSGLAMARWCAGRGASVRVWDSRALADALPALAGALAEHVPNATWVRGALAGEVLDAALNGVGLVLKSPGLSPFDQRIAPLLQRAGSSGVPVWGELELFARALADLKAERGYTPHVLAITGTNGKTTTTAMTALLVNRTGRRSVVAGNIGPTMLQTLADALAAEPLRAGPHPSPLPPAAEGASSATAGVGVASVATLLNQEPDADALPPPPHVGEGWGEGLDDAPTPAELADLRALDGAAANDPLDSAATPLDSAAAPLDDDAVPPDVAPPPPAAPIFEVLPEVWVLELSSFQLDGVETFQPDAAAILNLTQDHLDWHGSMAHYGAAKARIFGRHATLVINRDDPAVEALVPAPIIHKPTAKGRKPVTVARDVVRFGLDAPQQPGDFGIVEENGMAWLVRARELDETLKPSSRGTRAAKANAEPEALSIQRLMPVDALRVRGRHNAANALAALALATAIGCPLAPMLHGLREYHGEPHRVQFIASLEGVDAFDDSKGTNVGATVAALDGLGADKAPAKLVVILGGDGKGQDFEPLVEPVRRHVRAVATIGRDAARIEELLAPIGIPFERHDTLPAATRWCFERAQRGDAVLLSPACASLDMFRNYAHRAEVFVETVRAIVADHGGLAA